MYERHLHDRPNLEQYKKQAKELAPMRTGRHVLEACFVCRWNAGLPIRPLPAYA
jgi:hypothetical protein